MEADPPRYSFHKHRLPRDWSYPLKRSVLDARLTQAAVTSVWGVTYAWTGGQAAGSSTWCPLRVSFRAVDKAQMPAGLVDITVYAVPANDRHRVMALMEANLVLVCEWIRRSQLATDSWRMSDHELVLEVCDGQARLVESG